MANFIPRSPGPQVQQQLGPQVRNTAQVDLSPMARTAGIVGDAATQFFQKEVERADTARLMEARTQLSDWSIGLRDPNNPDGLSKYRGEAALAMGDDLTGQLDTRIAEISGNLTQSQQAQFAGIAANFRNEQRGQWAAYADKEVQGAIKAKGEAMNIALVNEAVEHGLSGDFASQESTLAELAAANERRDQLDGVPREVTEQNNLARASGVYQQTIKSIATADPFRAQEMLGKYRNKIAPKDRAGLESMLYPVIEAAQAGERFEAWLGGVSGASPNNYRDPGSRGQPSPAVRAILDEEADAAGIPREFLYALAEQESSFRSDAVNSEVLDDGDQAAGLMQYRAISAGGIDRMDPRASARRAAQEFRSRMDAHGPEYAVAAHFAGDGGAAAVIQHGRAAQNPRTALYVQEVMGRAERWRGGPVAGQVAPQSAGAGPRTKSEAMEYARSIRNLSERAAFQREANEYFALQDQRQSEAQRSWSERVNVAMQNADPTQPLTTMLGAEDYAVAMREGKLPALESLRLHQIQGTFVQDDLSFKEEIAREAVTDPDAFMRRDLNDPKVQVRLATDSLDRFKKMQAEASKPGRRDEWATESQLLGQAYTDIGLTGSGDANAKKRDEFERAYLREKRAFNEVHNGRNPTAAEMQAIINGLKVPMVKSTWFGFGSTRTQLYRAGEGFKIPADTRVEIIKGLQAAGIASPTEAQMVEAYHRGAGDEI